MMATMMPARATDSELCTHCGHAMGDEGVWYVERRRVCQSCWRASVAGSLGHDEFNTGNPLAAAFWVAVIGFGVWCLVTWWLI